MSANPESLPFDVFISHATENKLAADAVCAKLEAAGIRCWMATRDIQPGTEWGEAIINGLERCRVMVLIFSDHANSSPHVRREVERAVSKELPIIPLRIENTLPAKALEFGLSNTHWLDAFDPPLERHIVKLEQVVRRLLSDQPVDAWTTASHAYLARKQRQRRAAFWFIFSLMLLLVGYVTFREIRPLFGEAPPTAEQQATEAKLKNIHLESFILDGMPLSEVMRILSEESRKADPEHKGINFALPPGYNLMPPGVILDPSTGLPISSLEDVPITVSPSLKNVSLMAVLRAVLKGTDCPMGWAVEDDGGVVFYGYQDPASWELRILPAGGVCLFLVIYMIHLKIDWLATRLRRVFFWIFFVLACGIFLLIEVYLRSPSYG